MSAGGLADIPDGPHWAIIQTRSITIPGDERSRTAPGHGYPEHTETVVSYTAFTAIGEWESQVACLTMRGERFRAIKADVAKVSVKVAVE